MTAFGTMLRKQLGESRWFLGIGSAALFGLGWLSSFIACRIERQFLKVSGSDAERFEQFTRGMGGAAMDFSSLSFQVMFWNHPFVMIVVCTWAISRGSAAVAGEIERGTLDITLSRPVSRPEYLGSQVVGALLGFAVLASALVIGNRIGGLYNPVKEPPSLLALDQARRQPGPGRRSGLRPRPALRDPRRRPLAAQPLRRDRHDRQLRRGGRLHDPNALRLGMGGPILGVQGVRSGRGRRHGPDIRPHAAALGAVAATGIVLSFILFQRRDLPSNS